MIRLRTLLRCLAVLSIVCATTLAPKLAYADDDPCAPNYDCGCEAVWCVVSSAMHCASLGANGAQTSFSCDANTANCGWMCMY